MAHAALAPARRDPRPPAPGGRSGLSAAQLSRAMFGDEAHEVTVRAEVSRLRRTVGALVATAPYRISAELTFEVLRDR